MDDLINIIVIIGTIAVFIFSALRKTKGQPNSNKINNSNSFESLFGINIEPNNIAMPESRDPLSNQVLNEQKPNPTVKNKITTEGIDAIPNAIKKEQISNPIQEAEFDLKAAIVYSEILKRKEF